MAATMAVQGLVGWCAGCYGMGEGVCSVPYVSRVRRGGAVLWARGERLVGRLTSLPFHPLYHLGPLSVFLLLVLTATGGYLTLWYRSGADRAYESVQGIDAVWVGSLVRTVHRYAADGLIVTILLHALKMVWGDRFRGSRWLSWVSGWGLLGLIWSIGVMGYWLVWDERAQWLTEYAVGVVRGPIALTFASAESLTQAATFFVIVLFLHVFLSVAVALGLLVHVMRLARPRLWAPRWLMAEVVLVLVVGWVWRPATSAAQADVSRLVGGLTLDGWYLGFLPFVERWGSGVFWGVVGVVVVGVTVVPWLRRGRAQAAAVVSAEACTGCAVCEPVCPYEAIEMQVLPAGAQHPALAVVNADLCTGCGLCVGVCATDGIDIAGLPAVALRRQVTHALAAAQSQGRQPVLVFSCACQAVSGGRSQTGAIEVPGVPWFALGSEVIAQVPVVTCGLPCVGMVQPEMIRDGLSAGAQAVVVLGGPHDDCAFREGPHALRERLEHRPGLVRQGVYVLEATPGDRAPLVALVGRLAGDAGVPQVEPSRQRRAFSFAAGVGVLALALVATVLVQVGGGDASPGQGMVRVGFAHTAQLTGNSAGLSAEMRAKLPPGVSAEQIAGGERFPVRVRVEVDGALVAEREYRSSGLRREGTAYALESWLFAPGRHDVRLLMMDDGATWRETFAGPVDVEAGRVRVLLYDAGRGVFVAH